MAIRKTVFIACTAISSAVFAPVARSDVVINELMAINNSVLADGDGAFSDWIELHNRSSNTINLAGWYLTDDPLVLTKWRFPAVHITNDTYRIVFASSKHPTAIDGGLHTSFRLDGSGEYLALVRPDGTTIEDAFGPAFPVQETDVSYGIPLEAGDTNLLFTEGAPCRVRIPTDASEDGIWILRAFDDSAWPSGATGVGFDTRSTYDSLINFDVETEMATNDSAYIRVGFVLDSVATIQSLTLRMKYDDGFVAYINGVRVADENEPSVLGHDSSAVNDHSDAEAVIYQDFDASIAIPSLIVGTNVVAVHGLDGGASSDFLIVPRLEATVGAISSKPLTFLVTPTPGAINSAAVTQRVGRVEFSHKRGHYDAQFSLTLTPDEPGESIRYTLDCSKPTDIKGTLYAGPIAIAPISGGVGAVTVRAVGFASGFRTSRVRTHTFIFTDAVVQQPFLPAGFPSSWSGVAAGDYEMDPDIINDPTYTSRTADAMRDIPSLVLSSELGSWWNIDGSSGIYDSPGSKGFNWEREVSAEWIPSDEAENADQVDCGVRIQGGASRGTVHRKHSMSLRFRGIYGDGRWDYPLFPGSDVRSFDSVQLRAGYNNSWIHWDESQRDRGSMIRDQWMRESHLDMGNKAAGRGRYCHLYLNGAYWGVYNISERGDADHYSAYHRVPEDEIDARNGSEYIDGNPAAWNEMVSVVAGGNWADIQSRLDVNNYIDYMIVNFYGRNNDLKDTGNYKLAGGGPNRVPFEMYCWDGERVLEGQTENGVNDPVNILATLDNLLEFRVRFADRIHRHFFNNGAMMPAQTAARWMRSATLLDQAIIGESARWSDFRDGPRTRDGEWIDEQNRLINTYFPFRTATVLDKYKRQSPALYPGIDAPSFNQHGGPTIAGFQLVISPGPSGTLYYTTDGSDPRLEGGAIAPGALTHPTTVTIPRTTTLKARMLNGDEWSAVNEATFLVAVPNLKITEVMYHPTNDTEEFVEIQNVGASAINLHGLQFDDGVEFNFTDGTISELGVGAYALVVRNMEAFTNRYGVALPVAGQYDGNLNNTLERLKLIDALSNTVFAIEYSDARDWPICADGAGHSLVPLHGSLMQQTNEWLDFGGHWRASAFIGGSPGAADPAAIRDALINEVMAHTDADPEFSQLDSNDWLELFNATNCSVVLTNWYLSDDPTDLKKWGIPGTNELTSGNWLYFDEATGFHNSTHIGFGINKAGETLFVSHLPGTSQDRVADCVRFKGQENGVSVGRFPDGAKCWLPLSLTPGTANALTDDKSIYISEIMFHPAPTVAHPEDNDFHEYVELRNGDTSTVTLENPAGTWRIDGGIDFSFPPGVQLLPGESLLLVNFDLSVTSNLTDFATTYGIDTNTVQIFGPYDNKLSNKGDRIALEKPQESDLPGGPPSWIIVAEVVYFDQDPWPAGADATGSSLHQDSGTASGDDLTNWSVAAPSPGTVPATAVVVVPTSPAPDGLFEIAFVAQPGITYTVESKNSLFDVTWQFLDFVTGTGVVLFKDTTSANVPLRFYRVRFQE